MYCLHSVVWQHWLVASCYKIDIPFPKNKTVAKKNSFVDYLQLFSVFSFFCLYNFLLNIDFFKIYLSEL